MSSRCCENSMTIHFRELKFRTRIRLALCALFGFSMQVHGRWD